MGFYYDKLICIGNLSKIEKLGIVCCSEIIVAVSCRFVHYTRCLSSIPSERRLWPFAQMLSIVWDILRSHRWCGFVFKIRGLCSLRNLIHIFGVCLFNAWSGSFAWLFPAGNQFHPRIHNRGLKSIVASILFRSCAHRRPSWLLFKLLYDEKIRGHKIFSFILARWKKDPI